MPSNWWILTGLPSRWAPYDRNHGPGQGQLPVRTDYGPWVLSSNVRGSARPGQKVRSAEPRGNVFHAAGGIFKQKREFVLVAQVGCVEFVLKQQARH